MFGLYGRKSSPPLIIAAAAVAALVVYGLIRWLWVEPMAEPWGGGEEKPVTWMAVLVSTVIIGVIAWGVATVLERSGKARWWPFVGSTALAISIIGPSYLAHGSSVAALIILHFVVAIVIITGFSALILSGRVFSQPPSSGLNPR